MTRRVLENFVQKKFALIFWPLIRVIVLGASNWQVILVEIPAISQVNRPNF